MPAAVPPTRGEHHQGVRGGPAAQVEGVQHGDGGGAGDGSGDGGAGQHEQPDRARTALLGPVARAGGAQPLQRRTRPRGLHGRQGQRQQQRDGSGEQAGGDVRAQRRLVHGEPFHAQAQRPPDQRRDEQGGGRDGHRREGGAQAEAAQGVEVVRERAYRRPLRRRRGQQRGRGALLGQGPHPLGGAGDEDGGQQGDRGVRRDPVEPERGDDEQHDPQPVGAGHRPAAVQLAAGGGELGQRSEQDRAEQDGGEDAHREDGRDGEGGAAVAGAEEAAGGGRDGRLEGQQDEDQQGEGVTDAAHQLGAPQTAQPGGAQQRAHRSLAGVRG